MSISQITDARAKRQARAMRAKRKDIEEKQKPLPEVASFKIVGIKQYPGTIMLQMFGKRDNTELLAVAKLDTVDIEALYQNMKVASGVKPEPSGLILIP